MAQNSDILEREGYGKDGSPQKLKLNSPLDSFPLEIIGLGPVLQHLDLSNTGLSDLPAQLGRLEQLKVAFFSNCRFRAFPRELTTCARLEMVAFRGNGMTSVPEGSLPPMLRWLILTGNEIETLPRSIGACNRLQKCMLSGNRLRTLPAEMASCRKLGLLRLAANRIASPPAWLFDLPELAFLSLSGNPCCAAATAAAAAAAAAARTGDQSSSDLCDIPWTDVRVDGLIGEGASGVISRGEWNRCPVAVKLFKGAVTSDGTPGDELAACLAVGRHRNLIDTLGRMRNHPEGKEGLVMQLVPAGFGALGLPPSLRSCTRDCYDEATAALSARQAAGVLRGVAQAARHMHGRGVMHGDLYAHNTLVDGEGNAMLGDFGAATIYGGGSGGGDDEGGLGEHGHLLERLEVLAFAHLVEDVIGQGKWADDMMADGLRGLHRRCSVGSVAQRPPFSMICQDLDAIFDGKGPLAVELP